MWLVFGNYEIHSLNYTFHCSTSVVRDLFTTLIFTVHTAQIRQLSSIIITSQLMTESTSSKSMVSKGRTTPFRFFVAINFAIAAVMIAVVW